MKFRPQSYDQGGKQPSTNLQAPAKLQNSTPKPQRRRSPNPTDSRELFWNLVVGASQEAWCLELGALNQLRLFNLFRGRDQRRAIGRFGVFEYLALVIPDHDFLPVAAQDVVGINGHFAAAAGSVDDILRHGVTGSVAAQLFHDLEALAHAGAQMRRSGDQIALIEVVRFDPAHEQF